MSDLLGGEFIYSALTGDAGVTAITTAIYNARLIPQTETNQTTINFYRVGNYNARETYFTVEWSIDCRSLSQATSEDLALAVKDALNRETFVVGDYVYQ